MFNSDAMCMIIYSYSLEVFLSAPLRPLRGSLVGGRGRPPCRRALPHRRGSGCSGVKVLILMDNRLLFPQMVYGFLIAHPRIQLFGFRFHLSQFLLRSNEL